jgi:hypothetical protein
MDKFLEKLRTMEAQKEEFRLNFEEFEKNCDLETKQIKYQIVQHDAQQTLEILNHLVLPVITQTEIQIISETMLQMGDIHIHSCEKHRNTDLQNIVKTITEIKTKYPTWRLCSLFVIKINSNTYLNGYRYGFQAEDMRFQYDTREMI